VFDAGVSPVLAQSGTHGTELVKALKTVERVASRLAKVRPSAAARRAPP
jgi:hypothetical protein